MSREGLEHFQRLEEKRFLEGQSVQELLRILRVECGKEAPSGKWFQEKKMKKEIIKAILESKFSSE